jgi:4-hydroxy-2-oxoheptanedioate aldolase
MRRSKVLSKLRSGQVARICSCGSPLSYFPRLAAHFGYDGVWMDGEHRVWDPRQIETMLLHHRAADIDCIWRPSLTEKGALYRLLEDGATGLMIPMVNTPERARELVAAVRFPPLGDRGLDGAGLDAEFLVGAPKNYPARANEETLLVAQIETPEALANCADIAAVPGVDVLMIGPGDLSLRLGCTPAVNDPVMLDAEKQVAAAATRHGKAWGRPVGDRASAQAIVELGARFVILGGEFGAVHKHLTECAADLDSILGGEQARSEPAGSLVP